MKIYFDNAATTKISPSVLKKMNEVVTENYGNPSSLHMLGVEAEREITSAEKILAGLLSVKPEEIVFTSGGTESNTMAIRGAALAYARSGKHLITVKNEHPSVLENFRALEGEGFSVTYLETGEGGRIDPDKLAEALRPDTILVSIMQVNNETGVIQDVEALGKLIKNKNEKVILHTDGVQAFGKIAPPGRIADLFSISAHKIHGPKGAGALRVNKGIRLKPLLYGGGQQKGQRSGTQDTAGIAALAAAATEAADKQRENYEHAAEIKRTLISAVSELPNIKAEGDQNFCSPYILRISFAGLKGEVLLHALEAEGIFVSTGSACSSKKKKSPETESSLRFSFSSYNTVKEAKHCAEVLKRIVPELRKAVKR